MKVQNISKLALTGSVDWEINRPGYKGGNDSRMDNEATGAFIVIPHIHVKVGNSNRFIVSFVYFPFLFVL